MFVKIMGNISVKNNFKNSILGVISRDGIFITEMAVWGIILKVIFNPGGTTKISKEEANEISKGKELREFTGVISIDGKEKKIKGVIAENGILISVFYTDNDKKLEYVLWNPGITEEIEPHRYLKNK